MLLIPRLRNNGTVDLVVVLEKDNIDRIQQYDPAEIKWRELPAQYRFRVPATIGVTFATFAEIAQITEYMRNGEEQEAINLVTRGFEFRPELGDHDHGPQSLTGKKNS